MDEFVNSQKFGGFNMNPRFHRFVNRIVKQTDGNQMEKNDLYEELMVHLEMSIEQFIQEGFTEKQAEQKAMEHFGDAEEIGSQIQQAMFPFRKTMMLTLAITSIIFSVAIYLAQLFIESNNQIVWLMISIAISSLILIYASQLIPFLNRRPWLRLIIIIHAFVYAYGWIIAADINHSIDIALVLLLWFIISIDIGLLYLITIKSRKLTINKQAVILHILNIMAGFILVITTLNMLWGLLFASEWTSSMLKVFIPLLIWLLAYLLQVRLISRHKKIAYAIAIIPILILAGTVGILIILWRP